MKEEVSQGPVSENTQFYDRLTPIIDFFERYKGMTVKEVHDAGVNCLFVYSETQSVLSTPFNIMSDNNTGSIISCGSEEDFMTLLTALAIGPFYQNGVFDENAFSRFMVDFVQTVYSSAARTAQNGKNREDGATQ